MVDHVDVTPPPRRSTRVWLRLAPLALVPALLGLEPPTTWLGRPRACQRVVMVDGELRCDEEIERVVGCPSIDPDALASGDAMSGCVVHRMDPEAFERLELPVDVNRARPEELASLPGIGPALAERIVAGRPYASIDELDRVSGIGPKRIAALRARARVE